MTEDGKKVLEFIKEMRRLSEDLASLLKTVDDLMIKKGWRTATGSLTYANESSKSLDLPMRWYPYDLFRFYQNQNYKSILTFVSIILEEDIYWMSKPPATPINEPLISAGYFVSYEKEDIIVNNNNYWWARWYEKKENRIDDGRIWQEDYKDEKRITQEQWKQFDNYWQNTYYQDLTIDAFSKILGKDIKIPEGIDTEKKPDDDNANQKVSDEFYETVEAMKPKPFKSFKCFGYPLVSVTNATVVEFNIVKRLLDELPK
ncbi:MAG: hypothetical protein Q7U60_08880 [Candidatus Methanoperedens sp.]|nr:hypothetical protein [Candidatus Methanoperedens sp.]